MADQRDVVAGERDLGGTMRLGLYPMKLLAGSQAHAAYGEPYVDERHRHRFEVNNAYRPAAGEGRAGVLRAPRPDGRLVEIAELPADVHPFYVGTQAHPEFKSRPTRAHPLFRAFVAAAVEQADARDGPAARGGPRRGRPPSPSTVTG